MKIQYFLGDLLESNEFYIAHGCNAQGVMRSGVALAIRERYSRAYSDYKAHYDSSGLNTGDVITTRLVDRCIFNIVSQEFFGRDPNVVYIDYDAVHTWVRKLNAYSHLFMIESIGFPMIGAGLANGDWNRIAGIIDEHSTFQPNVYILDERTYKAITQNV